MLPQVDQQTLLSEAIITVKDLRLLNPHSISSQTYSQVDFHSKSTLIHLSTKLSHDIYKHVEIICDISFRPARLPGKAS